MASFELTWQPLRILSELFYQNVGALRTRSESLADHLASYLPVHEAEFFVAIDGNDVRVAKQCGQSFVIIPPAIDVTGAARVASKLFPKGDCNEPMLVAGLGQGWLWNALYELPISTPIVPGHRPPLYFLTAEIERLWIAMHLHDWKQLLADERVRLFVGRDAIEQMKQGMIDRVDIPMPRLSVTVEPSLWQEGATIDTITYAALERANARMESAKSILASRARKSIGGKLRVLGITSRYTTFIQYSMRDWLDAFASLGHETHLMIEPGDSSLGTPIVFAETCADFQPDLIVMIDHYRGELTGLPDDVPFVMWVQDQLPNIFNARAGAAQKENDYAIGYGRLEAVYEHGYPGERFRPAMIGTNEQRFVPRRLMHDERDAHTCDVSFVSHCSTPAELVLEREMTKHESPVVKRVFGDVFDQLKAEYDAGRAVTMHSDFRRMIENALGTAKLSVDNPSALLGFFTHKVNNALFRHQSLRWLKEMDVKLHLYGRGWEANPEFAQFAKGPADNASALSAIYQASRINLQVSPFGSAHQRVFDGLAAGGFFLLRRCDGDRADIIYRDLWNWCEQHRISNDQQLRSQSDPRVVAWINELNTINGHTLFDRGFDFVAEMNITAESGFNRNSATLWNEYDDVSYDTRWQLQKRVDRFLSNDAERARITRSMREKVLQTMTYRAIATQTLNMVQRGVASSAMTIAA